MWEEMERSPALAAPGSNNFGDLIASSTDNEVGSEGGKVQTLSDEDANDLSEKYQPLAYKIAASYRDKGIALNELRSAGLLGLVLASRKFDPTRDIPFGGYAQHWIRGEIRSCFKPGKDALGFGRTRSLNVPALKDVEGNVQEAIDCVADAHPVISPDLSGLSNRDRFIVQARDSGETLAEIGKGLGLSAERIRQIEALARPQIRGIAAAACIADLTKRGDSRSVIRYPEQHARSGAQFCDRPPPKHIYCEPKPSREITHHRVNASRLSHLRGGEPLRSRGCGPVIHAWGRP